MTMSQRLKITLSDAVMAELRSLAAHDAVPIARVAAERLSKTTPADHSHDNASALPTLIDDDLMSSRHTTRAPAWRRLDAELEASKNSPDADGPSPEW
jgi:hypothetical protein